MGLGSKLAGMICAATVLSGCTTGVEKVIEAHMQQKDGSAATTELIPNNQSSQKDSQGFVEKKYWSLKRIYNEYVRKHGKNVKRKIVIHKSERKLEVYLNDDLVKNYGISLGERPIGDKVMEGDRRTPEGIFYVARKVNNSRYGDGKALLISYPNKEDAERGLKTGLITRGEYNAIIRANDSCEVPPQNTKLGGLIEMHGSGGGPGYNDWTWGCVAMLTPQIDSLYGLATSGCGTKVIIKED